MIVQELGPNQTKWLEALESELYTQGTGRLFPKGGKYCCLGVAVELLNPSKRIGLETSCYLDKKTTKMLSLYGNEGQGSSRRDTPPVDLSELNDSMKKTFEQIAAIVREDPSAYFSEPS
jgi:hypothetical protein